eukprot:SAG31_NODE_2871_length_4973_cov_4.568322_2_plen_222_part_00
MSAINSLRLMCSVAVDAAPDDPAAGTLPVVKNSHREVLILHVDVGLYNKTDDGDRYATPERARIAEAIEASMEHEQQEAERRAAEESKLRKIEEQQLAAALRLSAEVAPISGASNGTARSWTADSIRKNSSGVQSDFNADLAAAVAASAQHEAHRRETLAQSKSAEVRCSLLSSMSKPLTQCGFTGEGFSTCVTTISREKCSASRQGIQSSATRPRTYKIP